MSKLSRLRAIVGAVAPEWATVSPRLDWIDTRHDFACRSAKPEPFEAERRPRFRTPAADHLRARRDRAPSVSSSLMAAGQRVLTTSLLLFVAGGAPAWAALGGSIDSVDGDARSLHATRRLAAHSGYEVHELTLASGTIVREFATSSGTVFGVAWQGPVKPDLSQLLGPHFVRMVAAGQRPHGDHRSLRVAAPDLVVESGGRMRAFAGRAYLPALLPATVLAGDVR